MRNKFLLVLVLVSSITSASWCADETVRLESLNLAIELDSRTAALKKIENRLTSDSKNLRDAAFHLATTRGELSPRDCRLESVKQEKSPSAISFIFSGKGLEIELTYRLMDEEVGAVRKFLKVKNQGSDSVTIFRVVMFDWIVPDKWASNYYPNGINQIVFHKTGTWYDNPINLFLRDDSGGWFMGVENPYFEATYQSLRKMYPTQIEVSYQPRWILEPGKVFESDPGFLGVFRNEKIYLASPAMTYFGGREVLPAALLDWGEVWAMQRYLENVMRPQKPKHGQHYLEFFDHSSHMWALVEVARKQAKGQALTPEEQAMVSHYAPIKFDPKVYPEGEAGNPVWYRVTPETVPFYKKVIDDLESIGHYHTLIIPSEMAGYSGWFQSEDEKRDNDKIKAMTDTWFENPAFPPWQEVADYATKKELGMFNFDLISREYHADKPEWKYLDAAGKRSSGNCYGNVEYAQWYAENFIKALKHHSYSQLRWDEGWMDQVMGLVGENAHCYDESHHHPAGDVSYHQYHNMLATLRQIREAAPSVRLIVVAGLIRAMPWAMKYLDGDSHTGAYENTTWFDRNIFFLPDYKCHRDAGINLIVKEVKAPETIDDSKPGWCTMLENPKLKARYKQRWDKWMSWIDEHYDYFRTRRDLFGRPDLTEGLEGSAHVLKDRGYLILHNSGKNGRAGDIPLNHWLGLEKSEAFKITQIYPQEENLGVWAWEDHFKIPVEKDQTLLLQIEPAKTAASARPITIPDGVVEKAFLNFEEAAEVIGREKQLNLWPAAPLPGSGNMPVF